MTARREVETSGLGQALEAARDAGCAHLPEIAERLLRAGRPGDEPVVFISNATTDRQKVVETTLGKCAEDFAADPLPPPVLVAIGPVVQYRKLLRWFDL